ncbi:tumor necrosis factor ligand superfamily member 10-like [Brienomyrus brachyistius]|uniref:tumor necrosis factor ligand superfamily member 10-like n=1 Tax=Brienomyrus brachyistius TaxID=42636 RepID=UPI0020B1EDBC|nr:tumor necrosis factor ligand superfamily member 10-like [Brienomyrus brachyistius]
MNMRSSMQWLALLFLAAILLQTIAVAVSFIYFSSILSTMKETFSKSSISCLMRANLRVEFDLESGKDDPCWRVSEQIHFLIEKTMSGHYEKGISSAVKGEISRVLPYLTMEDQGAPPRPEIAAHVTGGRLAETGRTEGLSTRNVLGQKIPAWESKRGLAFLHNMELHNGELIIPQRGLYYVYSQTYFRHSQPHEEETHEVADGPPSALSGKQMLQYIYKKVASYPSPILLMKNARTTCWSRDAEYGLYSIYQAGVVQLGLGDRLFVSVSNISTVDMDEKSSFFGAFLVS